MSAFMCSERQINAIVSKIMWLEGINYIGPAFCKKIDIEFERGSSEPFLVDLLTATNMTALIARYGQRARNMIPEERYEYVNEYTNMCQAYKALDSYIYQISEGDVCNTPLYDALVTLKADWADLIISGLNDYKDADWAL